MATKSLAVLDFESNKIRVTPNGEVSVIDALKACGISQPYHAWKKIKKQLCSPVHDWKFPGERQRQTPVANKEQLMQVLMLSPKAQKTDQFREWASSILVRYLDGDVSLAEEIFDRTQASPEDQARSAARINGKVGRNLLTATLKDRGTPYIYGKCTNTTYRELFDQDANGLRKELSLANKENPRDHFDIGMLIATSMAEWKSSKKIKEDDVKGDSACVKVCADSAKQVRSIM